MTTHHHYQRFLALAFILFAIAAIAAIASCGQSDTCKENAADDISPSRQCTEDKAHKETTNTKAAPDPKATDNVMPPTKNDADKDISGDQDETLPVKTVNDRDLGAGADDETLEDKTKLPETQPADNTDTQLDHKTHEPSTGPPAN